MSGFSRVFQRTARSAFQYQRGLNPVQNALGMQGTSRYMNGVRNYAAFTRDKPHVNIGMFIVSLNVRRLIVCRNHWPRRSRKGKHGRPGPQPSMLILYRPPSQPPSPSDRHQRATQSSSSMVPLTRPPRSASVESPSPLPTSSTRPTTATTPTSTAPVTPITSRT